MTAPISRVLDPAGALAGHLRKAESLTEAARAAHRRAHLLKVAYWVSGPFPGATELIVTVAESNGELALTAIKDTEDYRWTDDGGLSTCPDEYRTDDGASVDQLVEDIVLELDSLLGDDDPRRFWDQLNPTTYRVRLPTAADLDRITSGTPLSSTGFAGVLSQVEALGRLRTLLDQLRPGESTRRRDRSAGATAAIRTISAALVDMERAAIAEEHLLRLEVVVDRDPDAGTEVVAFVDGVPHRAEVTVADPGAGWRLADWHETGHRLAAAASPHAGAYIRGWFAHYEDSEFITR